MRDRRGSGGGRIRQGVSEASWKFHVVDLGTATTTGRFDTAGASVAVMHATSPYAHVYAQLGEVGARRPIKLTAGSVFAGVSFDRVLYTHEAQPGESLVLAIHESPHAVVDPNPEWSMSDERNRFGFTMMAPPIASVASENGMVACLPNTGFNLHVDGFYCEANGSAMGILTQALLAVIIAAGSGSAAIVPAFSGTNLQATFSASTILTASLTNMLSHTNGRATSMRTITSVQNSLREPFIVPDGSALVFINENAAAEYDDVLVTGRTIPVETSRP